MTKSRGVAFSEPVLEEESEQEEEQTTSSPQGNQGAVSEDASAADASGSRPGAPQRPGYSGLSSAQRSRSDVSSAQSTDDGSGASGSSSSKTPAAGVGTRTGPRPVPRSSGALRHVSSSRFKSHTFGSLPEDGPSDGHGGFHNDTGSTVQRRIDADARKREQLLQSEDFWTAESDDDDLLSSSRGRRMSARRRRLFSGLSSDDTDSDVAHMRRRSSKKGNTDGKEHKDRLGESSTEDDIRSSADEDEWSDEAERREKGFTGNEQSLEPKSAGRRPDFSLNDGVNTGSFPKRAWHPRPSRKGNQSPPLMARSYSGAQTPGVYYPANLNTPMEETADPLSPEFEPKQRLEWQTMLESVLASEVLRSETKRITSVDAPDLSKDEIMYRRWLDLRATLRGRGRGKSAVEAEEKKLKAGWPRVVKALIEEIKECRNFGAETESTDATSSTATANGAITPQSEQSGEAAEPAGKVEVPQIPMEDADEVFNVISDLLTRVDNAESQFPSSKKLREIVPEWNDAQLHRRLDTLRAWYNVTWLLQQQLGILRQWTGSETLAIDIPLTKTDTRDDDATRLIARANGEMEGMTFVERILKEDSLKTFFENRTLDCLNNLVRKARDTIKEHHTTFVKMKLPSFTPEVKELISFPMRLMEGALRLRLDYAGKIKEPSLLIVDSLTDDLRSALDMTMRTKERYQALMVADPLRGWDLQSVVDASYEEILRDGLRFFFRLISFKLKGSVFFKETEILDNERPFLQRAIILIDGGDSIVAKSMARIVNKLFARIVHYFDRELSAPSTSRGKHLDAAGQLIAPGHGITGAIGPSGESTDRAPPTAGGLTKGTVHLTLTEKVKWIHTVFDNVRIRSRKLLGFARLVRTRLDNSAEYDLASLKPPATDSSASAAGEDAASGRTQSTGAQANAQTQASETNTASSGPSMDLNGFMQTLINHDYFLVYTETYEAQGIYIIAEPGLHDKPEIIEELLAKCIARVPPGGSASVYAASSKKRSETSGEDEAEGPDPATTFPLDRLGYAEGDPRYLLLLTPRDPFLWTGRVMSHKLQPVDVNLADRRLRLIADGSKERLQLCKEHFYNIFVPDPKDADGVKPSLRRKKGAGFADEEVIVPPGFPLEVIAEQMAHISDIQQELKSINKGVYMLSDAILSSVPSIRRSLHDRLATASEAKSGEIDDLIQNCFSMATEQAFRALPFIESARLRGYMTLGLAKLAIDWVGFICDDCEPTDRRTFKWAVAALENAVEVTRNENIFHLSEEDFNLMRAKVASCMSLLISHFDILGARSSVAKAKEEQDRLEKEKAERSKAAEAGPGGEAGEKVAAAHRLVEGTNLIPTLNRADSGVEATEERWVQKMLEWDEARQAIEAEQRLIGRVLDDTRLEDQGLQFLASSSSRIQLRWQQGRFIGSGTFGTVYLAVNLDSGGLMAVKEIRFADISNTPSLYKSIKDEMDVMQMLSHPNIVEYYGLEVHRDKVYIFEEYCQGGSLAQLLEHGRIEDEAVIQVYTLQMLDGLVYLHSKDVVHRDIKPDNILLDHMGVIKFVDFGAAKVLAKNSRTVQRSRKGFVGGANMAGMVGPDGKPVGAAAVQSLQGTPMYMSPEVIKGDARGRRGAMDVWSLGCVVLEFATGKRPWSQLDNEWAIMFHIGMAQQHPPLPEPGQLSEMGIDFIRSCLTIDAYDRPSAAEMREHPWIQDLVSQMNAANTAEDDLTIGDNSGNYDEGGGGSSGGSASGSGSANASLSASGTSSYSAHTPMMKASDGAAGVAAMASTPGTKSVSDFIASRPSVGL